MAVPYYFGQQAIAERLGYRSPGPVQSLLKSGQLPAYKRRERNRNGRGSHWAWVISESAITAWEIAKGQESCRQYKQECEARRLQKYGEVA